VNEQSPEQIRREIDQTRAELGDTAAALAAKTDVKARAKEKVQGVKERVGSSTDGSPMTQVKAKAQQNPLPTAAIAAFVSGFVLGKLTSRS
jgi:ElaB/YqjD/DUF883 family membrane-anchored ribosome-binding protein